MKRIQVLFRVIWLCALVLVLLACGSSNTPLREADLTGTAQYETMIYVCCTAAPQISTVTPASPQGNSGITLSRGNPQRNGVFEVPPLRDAPGEQWRVEVYPSLLTTPLLSDGLLYTAAVSGSLFAIDAQDGETEWSVNGLGQLENTGAIAGEMIIVGGISQKVRAFDRSKGSELWSFSTKYPIQGSPLIVGDQVYIGTDREFYSLDLASGNLRWTTTTGDEEASLLTGMPAYDGGVIYTNAGNFLLALEGETGKELWRVEKEGQFFSSAVGEAAVYAGNWDHHLYAFERSTGNVLWQFEADGEFWSAPAVNGDVVYIGNKDQLYALDALDGELLWSFQAAGEPVSDPVIAGGVVYFSDANHEVARRPLHLYALDAQTGESLWVFENVSTYLPVPALGSGAIYITSNGELIALK